MGKKLTNAEVNQRIQNHFKQTVVLKSEYINRRTPVILECQDCGYTWETKPQNFLYEDTKSKQHYCPNCGTTKNGETFFCAYCGKEVYRTKSQIEKNQSGHYYCSVECGNKHKNLLRKESGEWDESTNYRKRAFDNYEHKCLICGWNEDEDILEVHHIDENHDNNVLDNLCIICPICHRKITLKKYKLDLINKKLIKIN